MKSVAEMSMSDKYVQPGDGRSGGSGSYSLPETNQSAVLPMCFILEWHNSLRQVVYKITVRRVWIEALLLHITQLVKVRFKAPSKVEFSLPFLKMYYCEKWA